MIKNIIRVDELRKEYSDNIYIFQQVFQNQKKKAMDTLTKLAKNGHAI